MGVLIVGVGAGCPSDPTGAGSPDGAVADFSGPDGGDGGGAVDFSGGADSLAADQGGGADSAVVKKPLLRIFDGLQGAAVIVCQDSNKQLGGVFERLVTAKKIVHGYVELTPGVETKLWVEPYAGSGCKNIVSSSSKLKLTPKAGEAYTTVIRSLTFGSLKKLDDDFTPPSAGKSRVRFYNGGGKTYDVCELTPSGAQPLASSLANHAVSAWAEREARSFDLALYELSSDGPCRGARVGKILAEAKADHTHTFFVTEGKSTAPAPFIARCDDSEAGVGKTPSICVEEQVAGSD